MKHKLVLERIEKLSGKTNERKEVQKKSSFFSLFWYSFSSATEEIETKKKIKPYIEVEQLRQELKLEEESNFLAADANKQLVEILLDLHKLGMIIYFDKPLLENTIISYPQWLVKKNFLFNDI